MTRRRSNISRSRGKRDTKPWRVVVTLRREGERKTTWHMGGSAHTTESAARKSIPGHVERLADGRAPVPRGWEPVAIEVSHSSYIVPSLGPYSVDNPLLRFDLDGGNEQVVNEEMLERARRRGA